MGTNKATRAFQPEICAAGAVRTGGFAGCLAHAKPRSREGKRTSSVLGFRWAVFNFRCSVRRAADGSPRVPGLADGLTRSREGRCGATDVFFATDEHGFSRIIAEGGVVGDFYSLLSRVSSLWQGCHRPLTPDPSPPFRGRGEDFVFFVVVKAHFGRAKLLLSRRSFEP